MFGDLRGSATLTASLDPKESHGVIGANHRAITNMVAPFQGFTAEYYVHAYLCGNGLELGGEAVPLLSETVPAANEVRTRRQFEDRRAARSDDLAIFLSCR